jgi:hypothetical protein
LFDELFGKCSVFSKKQILNTHILRKHKQAWNLLLTYKKNYKLKIKNKKKIEREAMQPPSEEERVGNASRLTKVAKRPPLFH